MALTCLSWGLHPHPLVQELHLSSALYIHFFPKLFWRNIIFQLSCSSTPAWWRVQLTLSSVDWLPGLTSQLDRGSPWQLLHLILTCSLTSWLGLRTSSSPWTRLVISTPGCTWLLYLGLPCSGTVGWSLADKTPALLTRLFPLAPCPLGTLWPLLLPDENYKNG